MIGNAIILWRGKERKRENDPVKVAAVAAAIKSATIDREAFLPTDL